MNEQKDRALTIKEVAEFLNISNQMVYNLIKADEIEAFKIGSAVRILYSDLMGYVNAKKNNYKDRGGKAELGEELALKDVSTTIEAFHLQPVSALFKSGSISAVIGECGSGKTTLLRCIAGLQEYSGTIMLGDDDVESIDPKKRRIGFLFQNQRLFPYVSGKKNITFQTNESISDEELSQMLTECGLDPLVIDLKKDARQIPPGMRQLALIVRKQMQQFSLLLLDDPFKNIEPQVRQFVSALIRSMSEVHGITVIIACSDIRDAAGLADYSVILEGGSLVQSGTMDEVYHKPVNESTMRLLSYFPVNIVADEVSKGKDTLFGLQTDTADGPCRIAFRADEIALDKNGIPVSVSAEQFYDGRKKIVQTTDTSNNAFELLVAVETGAQFSFVPTHPVFFSA